MNIHSLMQSTDEIYSVVASGSFAHRKKEMFRKLKVYFVFLGITRTSLYPTRTSENGNPKLI